MAKRGFFRQLIDLIRGRQQQAPPPRPIPTRRTTHSSTYGKSDFTLRRRAVTSISRLPMVNIDEVRSRVQLMDTDELIWTIGATVPELRWRARQSADRLTKDDIPMNPWWYK